LGYCLGGRLKAMPQWFWRTIAAIRAFGAGATLWAFLTSQIAAVYLWGPLLTAWGFIAGWKEGVPTPYLLAACSLIFGGISWAALQISTLKDKNRVRDRLNFSRIRIGRNIHGPGMFLGIDLSSQAAVPIEMHIQQVRTRLDNRVPAQTVFNVTTFIIPPFGNAFFDDHVIDIGNPPRSSTIEGFAEFQIKYGHPGTLKYDLAIRKQVVVAFNAQGLFESASWQNAA
jgi:hypothetical protein